MKLKKVLFIVLCLLLIGTNRAIANTSFETKAESAILIEATTGKILFENNAELPLPPASMTKIMTEYIVLEAIEKGELSWGDTVMMSDYAGWMGRNGGSRVYIQSGKSYTVKELYDAIAVASANDATVALAEKIAGTETAFVKRMNEYAKKFGMNNTYYRSSTGYPVDSIPEEYRPSIDGEHVMSAKDTAILARKLVLEYPKSLEIAKKEKIKFEGQVYKNWNWMVKGLIYEYEGLDGLKTGYTKKAGYCFVGTAEKEDMRLISVVMKTGSEKDRFLETKKILDYGFNNFEMETVIKKGEKIEKMMHIEVKRAKEMLVPVVVGSDLTIVKQKNEKITTNIIMKQEDFIAPMEKGTEIAKLQIEFESGDSRFITEDYSVEEVSLITERESEKANVFTLIIRTIGSFFSSLF